MPVSMSVCPLCPYVRLIAALKYITILFLNTRTKAVLFNNSATLYDITKKIYDKRANLSVTNP